MPRRCEHIWPVTSCPGGQPIYAVDVSTWPRCDAEASPERGFSYHPSRHSAGQPIIAGWAFQWIAQLGFARDSWTAPVEARRLHLRDNANQVAITQARALAERLPAGVTPLFVFDAGYDPAQLGQGLTGTDAVFLVRLRAGRCFYVMVASWDGLHPKQQLHPTRGTKRPRPIVRGSPDPRPGQPHPGADASAQGAMAVVAGPGHARPGGAVAGLRAPLRPRAHHPLL